MTHFHQFYRNIPQSICLLLDLSQLSAKFTGLRWHLRWQWSINHGYQAHFVAHVPAGRASVNSSGTFNQT